MTKMRSFISDRIFSVLDKNCPLLSNYRIVSNLYETTRSIAYLYGTKLKVVIIMVTLCCGEKLV